ncbi:MAG: efflux RND transporter periplasmic adaptor subunit [Deltaproteobacteria bacterium]
MKRWNGQLILGALALVALVLLSKPLLGWFSGDVARGRALSEKPSDGGSGAIDHYTCSMHPFVREKGPGRCPICGMQLVPVTRAEEAQGTVVVPSARQQLIGVRTSPVVRAPLVDRIRAVGRIAYDEAHLEDVVLKLSGYVERLYANETGQPVREGQPLFSLYSPELYAAERDLLLQKAGPPALVRGARERLRLWGLGDAQLDAIVRGGKPLRTIDFPSPSSGYIVEKNVVQGAAAEAGQKLFRIAGLRDVWVEAEVYEENADEVVVGQGAEIALDYLPGKVFEGRVSYVYPYLDPTSRTNRIRIELPNGSLVLRPGMYATVVLERDLGPRLLVPQSAVVYTGPRNLVFVDEGDGHFQPTEVQMGLASGDAIEITKGLREGERVVSSGNFLIAAESQIRSAEKYWEPEEADGGDAGD